MLQSERSLGCFEPLHPILETYCELAIVSSSSFNLVKLLRDKPRKEQQES